MCLIISNMYWNIPTNYQFSNTSFIVNVLISFIWYQFNFIIIKFCWSQESLRFSFISLLFVLFSYICFFCNFLYIKMYMNINISNENNIVSFAVIGLDHVIFSIEIKTRKVTAYVILYWFIIQLQVSLIRYTIVSMITMIHFVLLSF